MFRHYCKRYLTRFNQDNKDSPMNLYYTFDVEHNFAIKLIK